jgi:hypothetical protein
MVAFLGLDIFFAAYVLPSGPYFYIMLSVLAESLAVMVNEIGNSSDGWANVYPNSSVFLNGAECSQ